MKYLAGLHGEKDADDLRTGADGLLRLASAPPPRLRPLKMVLDGCNLLYGSGIQTWTMALMLWIWEDKTDGPVVILVPAFLSRVLWWCPGAKTCHMYAVCR
jgi:hypothetical protein